MKKWKKRLASLLCVVMAFTTVAIGFPKENVQAAEYHIHSYELMTAPETSVDDINVDHVMIEKGETDFDLADCICAYKVSASLNSRALNLKKEKLTYTSSNKKVLTVSDYGVVTAKSIGKAVVSISAGKEKMSIVVEVISPKEMRKYVPDFFDVDKAEKIAKKMLKAYGGVITDKNRFEILKYENQLRKLVANYGWYEVPSTYDDNYNKITPRKFYAFSSPIQAARLYGNLVGATVDYQNPLSGYGKFSFKIQKISGSGKNVTVTLKKNVTEDQIFGYDYMIVANTYEGSHDTDVSNPNQTSFDIYLVENNNPDIIISAKATVKKGSKIISIKTKKNLKAGAKYELIQQPYYCPGATYDDWTHTGKYKFTAK